MNADQSNQKERTQLFANARPYNPQAYKPQFASVNAGQDINHAPRSRYPPDMAFQYNDAMNDHMEAQNDNYVEAISSKISVLKDLTLNIGKESKATNGLLDSLGEQFGNTRSRVKGTMTRMIKTADESGVGWRQWLLFILFVIACFWLVMFL